MAVVERQGGVAISDRRRMEGRSKRQGYSLRDSSSAREICHRRQDRHFTHIESGARLRQILVARLLRVSAKESGKEGMTETLVYVNGQSGSVRKG